MKRLNGKPRFRLFCAMLRGGLTLMGLAATAFPQASTQIESKAIFEQLAGLQLDRQHVYNIHDINIRRDVVSISFDKGVIGFLPPVNGRVSGAVFMGAGEVVAIPPDATERQQLARYTQSPLFNERFHTAILRFTDNTYDEIMKAYQEHAHEDVEAGDRARLLVIGDEELKRRSGDFNHRVVSDLLGRRDHPAFLAQLQSEKLGWFSATYDQRLAEEVRIAGADEVWASFNRRGGVRDDKSEIDMLSYDIDCTIGSDMRLTATASLRFRALTDGERVFHFLLAPSLRVSGAAADGSALPFDQSGYDLVVVLPEPLKAQQEITVRIAYAGEAIDGLTQASPGVSRPFWHPAANRNDWARFALTFHAPAGMTVTAPSNDSELLGAVFTISKCTVYSKESGPLSLSTCIANDPNVLLREGQAFRAGPQPSGAKPVDFQILAENVLDQARDAAAYLETVWGAFPYKRLQISTLPAVPAQSGPALIYSSLLPFLSKEQREGFGLNSTVDFVEAERVFVREIARQWYGQRIAPKTYRDQWVIDGLAGYAAAMHLERKYSEADLQRVLDRAKTQLVQRSPEGGPYGSLGPLSIGTRLAQPRSTEGYLNLIENKSTWVIHMLRMLMQRGGGDSAFTAMLREVTSQFNGAFVTTADFKRIAEKHAGETLDWFFDDWVFGTGIPSYSLDYAITPSGGEFVVEGRVHQTGVSDAFSAPVPLYADDTLLGRVTVSASEEPFRFVVKQSPQRVLIDPKNTILAVSR
jgi:hypothetical protein